MTLQLYDTLTSEKRTFETLEPGRARIYVCGMTVYDYAHLGHARCYVVYDVLVRHLRASGMNVTYVRNVTDIDDKIVKRAREQQEDPLSLAERFRKAYADDMQKLLNLVPDVEPKVSDHLDEIRKIIARLIESGHAYASDGDVYFHVPSCASYGKLSHRKLGDLEVGASERLDEAEARRKRHPHDFALWKGSAPEELGWESPWGRGRPGWHIECSAMSMRYLGETFDLHGGGLDLVFPHHENEVAQSECATGKPFARHWMHNGFVQVNKEKMSKSLGNFFVLREALALHEAEAVRFAMLTVHYRAPLNLEWDLDEAGRLQGFPLFRDAEARLSYLYTTQQRLANIGKKRVSSEEAAPPEELDQYQQRLTQALDDDLNTPVALAHTASFLKQVNELCDRVEVKGEKLPRRFKALAEAGFSALGNRLGLGVQDPTEFLERVRDRRARALGIDCSIVNERIALRTEARKLKDYQRSDQIREELKELGVELLDGPGGTSWRLAKDARAGGSAPNS